MDNGAKFPRKDTKIVQCETLEEVMANEYDPEIMNLLVEAGADVNCLIQDKYSLLSSLYYIKSPKVAMKMLDKLLELGIDVNLKIGKDEERPAIDHLLEVGLSLDLLKKVVEAGADINAPDKNGERPLTYAAVFAKDVKIIKYLVEKGAKLSVNTGETPNLLADAAARNQSLQFIKDLIEYCRGLSYSNDLIFDAFMQATYNNNPEVIKAFKGKFNFKTADDIIISYGSCLLNSPRPYKCVGYLNEIGLDINTQNENGTTVLHMVARYEDKPVRMINILLDHGADETLRNKKGYTYYDMYELRKQCLKKNDDK